MKKVLRIVIPIITVLCGLITLFNVAIVYILPLYLSHKYKVDTRNASSVGIIGGADGPTSILVSGQASFGRYTLIFAILTILGGAYLAIRKIKKLTK